MDFWDSFAKKFADAADYTMKEAEKLTGTAKLKFAITNEQSKLEDVMQFIGKLRYDEYKLTVDNSEQISAACLEADKMAESLEKLELELAALKNYKICDVCGTKIDKEASYCSKCGTKF